MAKTLDGLAQRLGFQAIAENRAILTIKGETDEDTIHIIYRPQQTISPKNLDIAARFEQLQVNIEALGAEDAVDLAYDLAEAVHDIVIEWDVMETPEETVDLSVDRLARVDLITLGALYGAISADAQATMSKNGGMRSPTTTNGGSSRVARRTTSRAGASRRK